ncbi:MAG TPA: imidazoleglycerol-phosphate dehydratase HisB [Acidimicrobiia bacterium]|nr:imidazoleglycerol-phosphate dehydratase HisB [Acidimicrobiia bacterium]
MTRTSRVERTTRETSVEVELDLDGSGVVSVDTGVGFFDHLLTSLATHAVVDLTVTTKGDLEIDDHHTVEDTALAIGSALAEALGDRAGIQRFGDALVPMDEALARCAIDLSGRPYAVVDIPMRQSSIGNFSTQNLGHVVESLARTGAFSIHLSATGHNDHHVAEAAIKALARALREAVAIDPRRTGVASTKGTLE